MAYKTLLFLLLASSLAGSPVLGEPCPPKQEASKDQSPVTLQETLERAYMQNADLDAARAGLRARDEEVTQANAEWRPSLSVQGSQAYNFVYPINRPTPATRRTRTTTSQYTATARQNIFQGGGTVARTGQAESNVLADKEGLINQELQTLLTGVQAHTEVLATAAILNYRKKSEETYKKILERTQVRFEVGEQSRTDVEAANASYEGAIAEASRAFGDMETSKATYTRQVGSPPGILSPANVILEVPKGLDDALEVAKVLNPTIKQARYALEAAEYNVNLQMAGLLPTVNIDGNVGNNRRRGNPASGIIGRPKNTNLSFEAVVDVPLYDRGIPSSRTRQAYQQVAQQKVQLVNVKRQVVEAVNRAWNDLAAARASVSRFLAQVKSLELAVEGALEEVNVGQKTIIDVLELQEDLIAAQINLVRSQQSLIVSSYQLFSAMGRLTARDLKLKVKYYDPDAYYREYRDAWIQFWQGEDLRYVKDADCDEKY